MSQIITSLDLGCSQFKGIVAEEKKDGSFSVISAFKQPSFGFRKGTLIDFDEAFEALEAIFNDLKKISKKAVQNVFINLQSEYIKARPSRGAIAISSVDKEIKGEDVEKVNQLSLAFKANANSFIIHNVTKEYIIDDVGDIFDPLGMVGNRLEVETLIIEGVSSQITPLLKLFNSLGVGIGGMIFNPLAAAQSTLSKKQKNLGVLLIDLGFGTTNIAIYEEGKLLYAKTIPIGSSYITNDIAIGLKIPIDLAEKLKVNFGKISLSGSKREAIKLADFDGQSQGEISKKFLEEIIEVRMLEILNLVEHEMKAIGRSVHLPGGVVITGGGSKLFGIEEILKKELRLPVQIGLPNLNHLEILNPSYRELIDDQEFAVAVGLLLNNEFTKPKNTISVKTLKNFLKNLLP